MEEELREAKKLTAPLLKRVDVEELIEAEREYETLTNSEKYVIARAGDAEIFWKNHFKSFWKKLLAQELKFLGETAETPAQILYSRGILHMLYTLEEWFEEQEKISKSRFKQEDETDQGEAIQPVGKL